MPEYVFIDFDGVIADTYQICFDILHRVQPEMSPDQWRQQLDHNLVGELATLQNQLQIDFWHEYEKQLLEQPLVPNIAEALSRAHHEHPLIIAAASPKSAINNYLNHHQLDKLITEIHDHETSQSTDTIFSTLTDTYELPPKESVFISDTVGDIILANHVEIQPIAVTWGFHNEKKLRKANPATIIDSPEQLPGAIEEAFDFSEEYS